MLEGIGINSINFNDMMREIFIMACSIAKDSATDGASWISAECENFTVLFYL